MKKIAIVLIVLFSTNAKAQNFSWGHNLNHEGGASTILPNGDVIVVGNQGYTGVNSMTKLNGNGQELWSRQFGGSAGWGYNITSKGYDIYVTAHIVDQNTEIDIEPGSDITNYTHTGVTLFVAKLDSAGNKGTNGWINTYPRGTYYNNKIPNITVSNTTGKIGVVGTMFGSIDFVPSSTPAGEHTSDNFGNRYVLLLDNDGIYINSWFGPTPSGGYEAYLTAGFDSQDNIIAAGFENFNGNKQIIEKFSQAGTWLNAYSFGESGDIVDILVESDSVFYAVALSATSQKQSFIKLNVDPAFFGIDTIWHKTIPLANGPYWKSLKFGPDSTLLLGGLAYTNMIDLTFDGVLNETMAAHGSARPVIVNYDNSGEYISHRYIQVPSNASLTSLNINEIVYYDSTVVMVGNNTPPAIIDYNVETSNIDNGSGTGSSGFIVKWNWRNPSSAIVTSIEKDFFKLYPNPTNNQLVIQSNKQIQEIVIIDIYGKTVYKTKVNDLQITLDLTDFSNGNYFISIDSQTEKLIVQH